MGEQNPEDRSRDKSESTIGRRRLLKTSGIGLATLTLPTMSVAAESDNVPDPASVDPNDPESVRTFLRKYLQLDSKEDAKKAWYGLDTKQERAVSDTLNEALEFDIEVAGTVGDDGGVHTQSVNGKQRENLSGRPLGFETFKMFHTIGFNLRPGRNISFRFVRSGGRGTLPFWVHKGRIRANRSSPGTTICSNRVHRFKHTIPNTKYNARIRFCLNKNGGRFGLRKNVRKL